MRVNIKTNGSVSSDQKTTTVPTYGNWIEERGFGQQTSPSSKSQTPIAVPSKGKKAEPGPLPIIFGSYEI